MSSGLSILDASDKIVFSQTGTETLVITPTANPTLLINQESGEQLSLSASVQNLILSAQTNETLVVREAGHQTLIISDAGAGAVSSPFGQPYTSAEDGAFYYYVWQHADGTQWKAQRFEMATLELLSITGPNPQPATLTDFQNLSF